MPLNLNAPLAWTKADADEIRLLQNLQGNILKGHGRRFTANIFFRLDPKKPLESKRALREIANYHVTNAHRQLLDTQRHHAGDDSGGPFCHLALAFKAYAALGIDDSKAPKDPHFRGKRPGRPSSSRRSTACCWPPTPARPARRAWPQR